MSNICSVSIFFIHTAGIRYPILDVDEPLCDLGLPCLLCVFLVLLGRSHLASIFSSFHGALLGDDFDFAGDVTAAPPFQRFTDGGVYATRLLFLPKRYPKSR